MAKRKLKKLRRGGRGRLVKTLRTTIPTPDGHVELETTIRELGPLEDFEFPEGSCSPVFRRITHRGDRTTWPHLPAEQESDRVPAGYTAASYIRLLALFSPRLLEDGPCCARVNGHWVTPDYELLNGDDVVISRYVPGRREISKLPR